MSIGFLPIAFFSSHQSRDITWATTLNQYNCNLYLYLQVPVEDCKDELRETPFLVDVEECEDVPRLVCTEVSGGCEYLQFP